MGFYLYALREEKFSKNIYKEPSLRERIFTVHQVQHSILAHRPSQYFPANTLAF
jgi:hypothetical protein